MNDLEMQQYLFDLQGYIVIENALNPKEVARLNALIDAQNLPSPEAYPRFGSAPAGPGFLDWGKPFCDLLDHPAILPIMRLRLGDAFRLDRLYGMYMTRGQSYGVLHADYGATAPQSQVRPGEYFPFRANQIYEGFIVVAWALSDSGGEHGGFCCIPGSHKSNFRLPQQIQDNPAASPNVVIPEMPAGSVILFTESLTHGTADWLAPHQRRTLLYKYCVSHLAWTTKRVADPPSVELTPRQKILLQEPGDPLRHFQSLFGDELIPMAF